MQAWLGGHDRILQVLSLSKILMDHEAGASNLGELLASRRPRRPPTPAVVWDRG